MNEIKVAASRSRALLKETSTVHDISPLQGNFPNHSLFSQHIQTFSLLLLLFFWHCLQQKFLMPPLSEPFLPAAQSLSTVSRSRRSLHESTGKALIKHPVAVTSLSSNPSWIFLLLLLLQEIPAPSHHRATLGFVLSQVRGHCGQFWPARHV